jgi:L-alanine-DL-glutamate epimerase-like enolase superfamily enzyme
MQIRQVDVFQLEGVLEHPEPFWDDVAESDYPLRVGPGQYRVTAVFVEIVSDAGLIGLGGPVGEDEGLFIARQLAPALIGHDPQARLDIARLLDRLCKPHNHTARTAMSALDIALWDLHGKAHRLPVFRLLGGEARTTIPAYASADGFSLKPERVREQAQAFVDAGYRAIKWFFPYDTPGSRTTADAMAEDLVLVQMLREAVGDDIALMVDAAGRWDMPHTQAMIAWLTPFRLAWLEDPIPDDSAAYARLQSASPIPLATGADCCAPAEVEHLLNVGAAAVLQPDVSRVGGISALVDICGHAASFHAQIVPHGGSVAATAHVLAAQPAARCPLLEFLPKWQAIDQYFFATPLVPEDGAIRLCETPGLGVALDPGRIHRRRRIAAIA